MLIVKKGGCVLSVFIDILLALLKFESAPLYTQQAAHNNIFIYLDIFKTLRTCEQKTFYFLVTFWSQKARSYYCT